MISVQELGEKLVWAGRLKLRPLCVYEKDEIPQGAVPSYAVDRCIARAVYTAASSPRLRGRMWMRGTGVAPVEWSGWVSMSPIQVSSTS